MRNLKNKIFVVTEENISQFEEKIKELDLVIAELDYSDTSKSEQILSEYNTLKTKLDEEMLSWESNTEELMTIED